MKGMPGKKRVFHPRTRLTLLFFLTCFVIPNVPFLAAAADFTLGFTIPSRAELYLSTAYVDHGLPRTKAGIMYYEGKNAVRVHFRSNITSEWEIHISGTDFRSATGASIPITRLQWRTGNSDYCFMPPEGKYMVVTDRDDFADIIKGQKVHISYYLELLGNEYGGVHTAVITYSFFIP
jgi:hypothetical protein